MSQPGWITKLKTKWNIQNDRDFWMIMLTFSLAGSAIMLVRRVLFPLLGIKVHIPVWLFNLCYIPPAFIVYQIGLLFFGTILGQFKFFWAWEKNLLRRLRLIRSKNAEH